MAEGKSYLIDRLPEFERWFERLRDIRARAAINRRILRLQGGNVGDAKPVGDAVSELRIDYGPGYRVYFTQIGSVVVVLLCGGDKSSQQRDIAAAQALAIKVKAERK